MKWMSAGCAVFAAGMICASASANGATYRYTDLVSFSVATGINEAGTVVGYSYFSGQSYAAMWSNGTFTNLDPGGASSAAFGINDAGQIVGYVGSRAAVWNGGVPSYLPTLGNQWGTARAISNAGDIAGDSLNFVSSYSYATRWVGGAPTELDALSGSNSSFGFGINTARQVVGNSNSRATLWNGTTAIDLGTLGGTTSYARAINNLGQVVGVSAAHAVMWSGTSIVDLAPLDGLVASSAFDINDAGVVVGTRASAGGHGADHATVWNGTVAADLNLLLEDPIPGIGWTLTDARAINNKGWIVGMASNEALGLQRAYLLTPVPEPATSALAMVGLLYLIVRARRGTKKVAA